MDRTESISHFGMQSLPPSPLWIGSVCVDPPVLQAPMAGFTNYAFRQMVRGFGGAGLLATEMISAKGFIWLDEREQEAPDRLWGIRGEPRPLAVQIWDNDPDIMARVGAKLAHDYGVSVVDINFGCPVRQVTAKAHSGSYLLRHPERIERIVRRVVEACTPIPVTAKIRLGISPQTINATEVAGAVETAGAAALTVHGRTAKDGFAGQADWERISEIKQHLRQIPLIGNGDLDSPDKVVAAFQQYSVDGVMVARAALGRPWLFRQIAAALRGEPLPPEPALNERRRILLDHYRLILDRFGETKGTMLMRKYASRYAQGLFGARHFRGQIGRVSTRQEFCRVVNAFFPQDNGPEPVVAKTLNLSRERP